MDPQVHDRIKAEIDQNKIILFMKGDKQAPQCGFSAQVVQILNSYGVDFKTINILEDHDLREGIKEYSNWPTIPQLYVNGEFVGGCDISMELHRKGKMQTILEQAKS